MTVPPMSDEATVDADGTARVAVALAVFTVVVVLVSYSVFFVALAVGGDEAISDTWVGAQAAVVLFGGLLVSLVAFVLAVVVRVRRERSRLLWLPLSVFPDVGGPPPPPPRRALRHGVGGGTPSREAGAGPERSIAIGGHGPAPDRVGSPRGLKGQR